MVIFSKNSPKLSSGIWKPYRSAIVEYQNIILSQVISLIMFYTFCVEIIEDICIFGYFGRFKDIYLHLQFGGRKSKILNFQVPKKLFLNFYVFLSCCHRKWITKTKYLSWCISHWSEIYPIPDLQFGGRLHFFWKLQSCEMVTICR